AKAALASGSLEMARSGVRATDTTQRFATWDAYLAMAELLQARKQYTSALQYAAPAYVHTNSKEATMLYAQLLHATGKLSEARAILEKAAGAGQASVGMKALLQEIYARTGDTTVVATQ